MAGLRLCLLTALLGACDGLSGGAGTHGGPFAPDGAVASVPVLVQSALCTAARASEDLRPRADLTASGMGPSTGGGGQRVAHTSDLFVRFRAACGACHVDQSLGSRHIADEQAFVATFDSSWLDRVKSDDLAKVMPPPPTGKPFSMRQAGDSIFDLVTFLEAWLAAGRPSGVFPVGDGPGNTGNMAGTTDYSFAPEVAASMTNLGNCIPTRAAVASSTSGEMESLDTFFAGAQELPQTLAETDLTTFDSAALANTGVIAFAPTYPLYSDGSGKLRHIRVPRGKSVAFDRAKQTFDIPPNTRFYKTFFRKVIDRTGQQRNRKMETRLIVARPDGPPGSDGAGEVRALFGTYIWNEDETMAALSDLPYRDGAPFADQVRTYVTDELAYQAVVDGIGPTGQFDVRLNTALAKTPTLQQHYAVPGRIRCVQCHMGSQTGDFVLGFVPLQIARRETGSGGTYEPTGEDELNQLQRLIDYGVVTGMTLPSEVLPLEKSQGSRKPRTDAELTAQAYMMGNCAHCHNPRGFPSISKPELKAVLDMRPDGRDAGIFEFPLERSSPLRFRGAEGKIPMPYITPSLRDYPVANLAGYRMDTGADVKEPGKAVTWTRKYLQDETDAKVASCTDNDPKKPFGSDLDDYCGDRTTGLAFVAAPWRSLLYRNVDTPFSYFDDYVPFPHMPMHSAGFDCRAPRIMGDWMVGLPAARVWDKTRFVAPLSEDLLPGPTGKAGDGGWYDAMPQPYESVAPADPRYTRAVADARARLDEYHASVRYQYCEAELSRDIYDPVQPSVPTAYRPDPLTFQEGSVLLPNDPTHLGRHVQPAIGVPYHSHYFDYDPTDPPPPWSPRRPDWQQILVERKVDTAIPGGFTEQTFPAEKLLERALVVEALNQPDVRLTDKLRAFATTEVPFGLWQVKAGCEQKLANQPKASSFTNGVDPPAWLAVAKAPSDAPVYRMAPGAALYRHICINCHGPRADGKGLQVDLLAAASNGEARPANFRDGLFGPADKPGTNVLAFDYLTGMTDGGTAALWGAKYMAWMALGGTLKRIPQDIIHLVEATRVLGESRKNLDRLPGSQDVTGNMLNLARGLCTAVLPEPFGEVESATSRFEKDSVPDAYPPYNASIAPFISSNGDKEMWLHLCSDFSPTVVRVYEVDAAEGVSLTAMYLATGYPADGAVLDHAGKVQLGVNGDRNRYPACVKQPADATRIAWLATQPIKTKLNMPDCPATFLAAATPLWKRSAGGDDVQSFKDNVQIWSLRGAIATGMTVFAYLQSTVHQTPKPYYNECQLLP